MDRRLHHRHLRSESPATRLDEWRDTRYGVAGFTFPTVGLQLGSCQIRVADHPGSTVIHIDLLRDHTGEQYDAERALHG
jgi:hypothetical protein